MKQFFLGALVAIAVLAVGGIAYLKLGFAEVRGDVPPSYLESSVLRMAVHASVRRHAPDASNPVSPTEEDLIAGGVYLPDQESAAAGHAGVGETGQQWELELSSLADRVIRRPTGWYAHESIRCHTDRLRPGSAVAKLSQLIS